MSSTELQLDVLISRLETVMTADRIERHKNGIIEKFGPWSAHNIHLGAGVYTIGDSIVGDEIKLRRIVQSVADVAQKPISALRILDLACLEGLYAAEFARHGAEVVGVEIREANIEKARFAKEILGLQNLTFMQDDVRNISVQRYGHFDVVLCLGILYHLDAPDIFSFLERMSEVCRAFAVIDTHIGAAERSHLYKGKTYWGSAYAEHALEATPEHKAKQLWASIDNPASFWFTRPSLLNALTHVGFTSIYECHTPPEPQKPADRVTLVAIKGSRQKLLCSPLQSDLDLEDLEELRHL
jgi:2-polyprenyl-3-methyl-5-hydroxy-6-metoxy-1,4-benzoquinol methylase